MPVNSFSVGKDVALDIIGPNGPIRFTLITMFDAKQDTSEVKVKGLDGITRPVVFYDGWSGSFALERQDSSMDDYFAKLEADYYAGVNQSSLTIMETITEVSGAVSQYRYTGVILKFDDAGSWSGDATVKQKFSFIASRRLKVA